MCLLTNCLLDTTPVDLKGGRKRQSGKSVTASTVLFDGRRHIQRPGGTETEREVRRPLCEHMGRPLISALVPPRNKLTSPELISGLCIIRLPNPRSYSTYHSNHSGNAEFGIRPQHASTNSTETNPALPLPLCCSEAEHYELGVFLLNILPLQM